MNLATEIASIRERLAANQQSVSALCREAGVARSTWDRWERGETSPNLNTWFAVCAAADRLTAAAAPAASVEDAA